MTHERCGGQEREVSRRRRSLHRRLGVVAVSLVLLGTLAAGTLAQSTEQPRRPLEVDALEQANIIRIEGAAAHAQTGDSVAGVGDVNGDGRPDVLVDVFNTGTFAPGLAYVVFGQASPTTVDLAALGRRGFKIKGASAKNVSGDSFSVAGASDMNGDGLADLLLGDALAENNGFASGSVYVVFGSASLGEIDLSNLGARGFRIDGAAKNDLAGSSVAAAGDVNGDGRVDVLVSTNPCCEGKPGPVYVVFGQGSPVNIDLAALGQRGFRIDGADSSDFTPVAVAAAGDVNGDGRADLVVGANQAGNNGREGSGSAYIVFGSASPTNVDLAALGNRGFRIDGAAAFEFAGVSAAGAGDVNGDGRADVLVGANYAGNNGRDESGSAYVVFGSASTARVDLGALGTRGFDIDGAAPRDHAGASVAGAGDVNGDGRLDVLVGADGASAAYIVFGTASPSNVDLGALGERGFRIDGAAGDFAGGSVAGVGDMNADGRADVLVGAKYADSQGRKESGAAYVVFGKASTEAVEIAGGADKTPPTVVLGGATSQRVGRQKGVIVTASCNEPCSLRASGTVSIVGQATKLPLTPASGTLGVSGRRTLKLLLPGGALAQLDRALRQGKRARATVAVRAIDSAANASTARRTVSVRR